MSLGPTQCSKCKSAFVLSTNNVGFCTACATNCVSCFLSSNRCYQCASPFLIDQNQQCVQTCAFGTIGVYDPSLGHSVCKPCHPFCRTCQLVPENCLTCSNSTDFLSNETGIYLCYECSFPCQICLSTTICQLCSSDFTLINGTCVSVGCASLCSQCGGNNNCLLCSNPYVLYNNSCMINCPSHSFLTNTTCIECPINCSTCINS
jgi:hypothetical protein